MKVKVIVVNGKVDGWVDAIYIGRENPSLNLPESPFCNPYKVGKDGDRERVIEKFEEYFQIEEAKVREGRYSKIISDLHCLAAKIAQKVKREKLENYILKLSYYDTRCHGNIIADRLEKEIDRILNPSTIPIGKKVKHITTKLEGIVVENTITPQMVTVDFNDDRPRSIPVKMLELV